MRGITVCSGRQECVDAMSEVKSEVAESEGRSVSTCLLCFVLRQSHCVGLAGLKLFM